MTTIISTFSEKTAVDHERQAVATSPSPPIMNPVEEVQLHLFPALCSEVDHVIRGFPNKQCPMDVLPLRLIKNDPQIVQLFTEIVNESMETETFPACLKHAVVIPVIKKHGLDHNTLSNFRPVSNLSFLSKLIERCVLRRLTRHLESIRFLHPCQSAYRTRHSTETAVLRVVSDWRSMIASGKSVCAVSLDVTAAFDTVDHSRLLMKLYRAGVWGPALRWFESYLSGRTMSVKAGTEESRKLPLSSGVPQGSVLGPTLFNVYMADLCHTLDTVADVSFHVYADDVIIYAGFTERTMAKTFDSIQDALILVESWMSRNKLLLSPTKTSSHIFLSCRASALAYPPLHLDGVELLSTARPLRWLGVELDPTLTMQSFVTGICRAAYAQLRMIRHVRPSLDRELALLLCNSLVLSRVDYCNSLLIAVTEDTCNKVQRVLKLAARTVFQCGRSQRTAPLLHDLQWLPARKRFELKILRLVHLSLYGLTPTYLTTTVRVPPRHLRRSDSDIVVLETVVVRRRVGDGAWEVAAPAVWNALPENLRCMKTFSWTALESHLLLSN